MNKDLLVYIVVASIKIFLVFSAVQIMIISMIWLERKIMAHMQVRLGPMRVGPHGLLQPIADGIKLLFKEDIIPQKANKLLFLLAPVMTLVAALITFAVIPFGDKVKILWHTINLVITDINVGFLYIFAVSSLGIYGIVMAGWASNNKYSLLGGVRSAAQMISYELVLSLTIVWVIMVAGTTSLHEIVLDQAKNGWYILRYPPFGILAAIMFLTGARSEEHTLKSKHRQ